MYPKKMEVITSLEPVVEGMLDKLLLKTGEKAWQPSDFVPDLTKEGWEDEVKEFRARAAELPDETLVVLVGDMVTEEALPTYQTLLNTFEGVEDPTGTSQSAWCKWTRGWTSEENRHGDLLNRYLYLTGRCDMRSIEVTIQHLITSGFNPKIKKDPYKGFIYTSFQERATKISHQNVARLANQAGDGNLAMICSKIAGDESRHEKAYQAIFKEILERDPEGALESFYELMTDQVCGCFVFVYMFVCVCMCVCPLLALLPLSLITHTHTHTLHPQTDHHARRPDDRRQGPQNVRTLLHHRAKDRRLHRGRLCQHLGIPGGTMGH